MNEGSTSIQFELIPHAFSIPIICDGNFCQNDGDLDDDGVKDEYDADPNDPSKSTIYPLVLRDNASDNSSPMSGLALWLDASNIDGNNNSSLSDGDTVSEWKDLSGNGNDMTSFGGPQFSSNKFLLDGIDDYLQAETSEQLVFPNNTSYLIISVYDFDESLNAP